MSRSGSSGSTRRGPFGASGGPWSFLKNTIRPTPPRASGPASGPRPARSPPRSPPPPRCPRGRESRTSGRASSSRGSRAGRGRPPGAGARPAPPLARGLDPGAEADPLAAGPPLDDALEAYEGAPAQEQDVRGVDLDELLLRVLAAALGRHRGGGALDDLEQRLLHALARHVARDRRVLALARDLVDLVDVDDAPLRTLDVVVRVLQQVQDDVLDVLAHVARLGQRGGVGDREG